jgi:putative endonuclease
MAREKRATQMERAAMWKSYYVYILASARNGTLYIGVTNDIVRRAWQHREGIMPGFTQKFGVRTLVHFEMFENIDAAIHRETRMKTWKRRWKLELIEKHNPDWRDLYLDFVPDAPSSDDVTARDSGLRALHEI